MEERLQKKLQQRILQGNLRNLSLLENGVDFISNDYLGFKTNALLTPVDGSENTADYGSTGSRLLSGNSELIMQLENQLALFYQTERALIFNSGYNANLGLLSTLIHRHTWVIYDELCHASIIDGIQLGMPQQKIKFSHNNLADLEQKLSQAIGNEIIVVTESLYSMTGDEAPMREIAALKKKHAFYWIVDEAHATGIYGLRGEGCIQTYGLQNDVFARVHTFGKALGCHGACIAGGSTLINYLINFCRSWIYTTSLPPVSVQAIQAAYRLLPAAQNQREQLMRLIQYFKNKIQQCGDKRWRHSTSPIQSLMLGEPHALLKLGEKIFSHSLRVGLIRHPTVPEGQDQIRLCLHAFNTTEQIDQLFKIIYS